MTVLLRLSAATAIPTPRIDGIRTVTVDLATAVAPDGVTEVVGALEGADPREPVVVLRPLDRDERGVVVVRSLRRVFRHSHVVDLPHRLGPLGEVSLAMRTGRLLAGTHPDLTTLPQWCREEQLGMVDLVRLRSAHGPWAPPTPVWSRVLSVLPGVGMGVDVSRDVAVLTRGRLRAPALPPCEGVLVGTRRPALGSALAEELAVAGVRAEVVSLPRKLPVVAEVLVALPSRVAAVQEVLARG